MAYFGGSFSCIEDVFREFSIDQVYLDKEGYEILYADYETEPYSGSSFVLLRDRDNNYLEMNSSHCSCNGLVWNPPEVTTKKALLARPNVVQHVKELLKLSLLM